MILLNKGKHLILFLYQFSVTKMVLTVTNKLYFPSPPASGLEGLPMSYKDELKNISCFSLRTHTHTHTRTYVCLCVCMCIVVLMVSTCLSLMIKIIFIFLYLRMKDYWSFLFVTCPYMLAINFDFYLLDVVRLGLRSLT